MQPSPINALAKAIVITLLAIVFGLAGRPAAAQPSAQCNLQAALLAALPPSTPGSTPQSPDYYSALDDLAGCFQLPTPSATVTVGTFDARTGSLSFAPGVTFTRMQLPLGMTGSLPIGPHGG